MAKKSKELERVKTNKVLGELEPLLAQHLWECADAALKEAYINAGGAAEGIPDDRLRTLPVCHPAHLLPALYRALGFPGEPLQPVWPTDLPPREVQLQLPSAGGAAVPGSIVGWDGDAISGTFLVAELGAEASAPFSGADPKKPDRWHRVSLADVCAATPPAQLVCLRDWLAADASLWGTKGGPQATVAVGTLRLPAPECLRMPGACFERLPSNAATGKTPEEAKTKRHLWSFSVGSPGEVVLLFTAPKSVRGMNTRSREGWDICVTQLALDSCPRFRRDLPGECRLVCLHWALSCASLSLLLFCRQVRARVSCAGWCMSGAQAWLVSATGLFARPSSKC